MKFRMTPVAAALATLFTMPSLSYAQEPATEPAPSETAAPAQAEAASPKAPIELPAVRVVEQQETPKAERVSSPKFTEPLLNTTQTITVIKKEVLQQQAATTLTEALRNTPGITFTAGENGNTQSGDTVFMRGFDTQGSIYLDNVRDLGAAVRDVFNVEQIEIVKGPAGADNGRGATSGYINLSSKLPQADDFIAGSLSYGTAEKRRITADINEQIGSGTAVRLNLVGQDGGVAGRDFVQNEKWGIAPSVAFGLGTATRISLFSQHIEQNNIPDGLVPTAGLKGYRFSTATATPVQQTLDANGIVVAPADSENFYGSKDDFEDIDANMYTVKFEHDLSPNTTVRNLSRYGKSNQERVLTSPNGAPTVTSGSGATTAPIAADQYTIGRGTSRHASYRTNEILTNQTGFTTNFNAASMQHTLGGGFEFLHESQLTPTYATVAGGAAPTAVNFYNPNRNVAVSPLAYNGAYTDGKTMTMAAYLFDTVKLNEQWSVNASLRTEYYDTETTTVALTSGVLVPTYFEDSGNLFSWKAGVLFKPVPQGSVYAAYANALKPPGGDNFTLVGAVPNATTGAVNSSFGALDPQEATNIELGVKWDFFGGKLATTAAVFRSENKNDLARADPSDPNVIIQYGEKQVDGIELGVVGLISNDWTISFGVTKQDTEVTDGQISNATGASTQTGSAINWSPELTATLWTTYKIAPLKLTVGGGARYVDSQVRSINNNPNAPGTGGQIGQTGLFEVEDYTVFDLMASYEATKNVTVQFNAYNVFDKEYVASLNNSGQRYKPGEPLSYTASVVVRF